MKLRELLIEGKLDYFFLTKYGLKIKKYLKQIKNDTEIKKLVLSFFQSENILDKIDSLADDLIKIEQKIKVSKNKDLTTVLKQEYKRTIDKHKIILDEIKKGKPLTKSIVKKLNSYNFIFSSFFGSFIGNLISIFGGVKSFMVTPFISMSAFFVLIVGIENLREKIKKITLRELNNIKEKFKILEKSKAEKGSLSISLEGGELSKVQNKNKDKGNLSIDKEKKLSKSEIELIKKELERKGREEDKKIRRKLKVDRLFLTRPITPRPKYIPKPIPRKK